MLITLLAVKRLPAVSRMLRNVSTTPFSARAPRSETLNGIRSASGVVSKTASMNGAYSAISGAMTTTSCGFRSGHLRKARATDRATPPSRASGCGRNGIGASDPGCDRTGRVAGWIVQLENIALDLTEHGLVRRRLQLVVLPRWVQFGHALKKFAAEFAEGGEERIAALELQIELRAGGRFAAGPQLFALATGYRSTTRASAASGRNAPRSPARVPGRNWSVKRRQGRDAKNRNAFRQGRGAAAQGGAEFLRQCRRMQTGRGADQLPPEDGLPVLFGSTFPIENHAWSEGEILVKRVGNFSRELEAAQLGAWLFEVAAQIGKLGPSGRAPGAAS